MIIPSITANSHESKLVTSLQKLPSSPVEQESYSLAAIVLFRCSPYCFWHSHSRVPLQWTWNSESPEMHFWKHIKDRKLQDTRANGIKPCEGHFERACRTFANSACLGKALDNETPAQMSSNQNHALRNQFSYFESIDNRATTGDSDPRAIEHQSQVPYHACVDLVSQGSP